MSNTAAWRRRQDNYHYSQDERTLSYKYGQEIKETVNKFLDDVHVNSLSLGVFDLHKEPWRLLAVREYRNLGLKIIEKDIPDQDKTELIIVKKSLASHRLNH
jgi:hypothetical protein